MPMPEWYEDAKEQLEDTGKQPEKLSFQPVELEKVEKFPTHFAEYELQEGNVLVHLFPRGGLEDAWNEGHYINRCHNCKAEVEMPSRPAELKPCPKCGHTGLIYVPGRTEEKAEVAFPADAKDLIKEALDTMWAGDAALDFVEELGAYAIQFQSARNTAMVVGLPEFVEKFCEALDHRLSQKN